MPEILHHFLGSNSARGFHSLYGELNRPDGEYLYIIKGGPGCGKSSFMSRIGRAGEERGESVEYIHCSGDPDSLDAVRLPDRGVAYVDGTSPHVCEAACPAAASAYLDLGRFYDDAPLRHRAHEIRDINRRCAALYSAAYDRIAAAALAAPRRITALHEDVKLEKKLSALASREFGRRSQEPGRVSRRFLSAVSCAGPVTLPCTAGRVWLLDNLCGLAGEYLSLLAPMALERGHDTILYLDCLEPEKLSGLYLPDLDFAILAPEPGFSYPGDVGRHVHLDALIDPDILSRRKPELRRAARLSREMLLLATDTLAEAKGLHDELEAIYNPHVDFDGVYALADSHIARIFP